MSSDQVRAAYDEVASEYANRISDELAGKPLDRALLDVFAQHVGPGPRVCDAGCGPGHVARYLHDRGVNELEWVIERAPYAGVEHPSRRAYILARKPE